MERDKVDTSLLPIWTQVHGLPIMFMTQANATKLAAKAGSLIEIHGGGKDEIMVWKFLRFKVLVNLNKPLFAGCFVPCPNGRKVWAQFRYEQIAALCHKCGILGHDLDWCFKEPAMIKSSEGVPVWKYGSWIRFEAITKDCFGRPACSSTGEDRSPVGQVAVGEHVARATHCSPRPVPLLQIVPVWESTGKSVGHQQHWSSAQTLNPACSRALPLNPACSSASALLAPPASSAHPNADALPTSPTNQSPLAAILVDLESHPTPMQDPSPLPPRQDKVDCGIQLSFTELQTKFNSLADSGGKVFPPLTIQLAPTTL